MNWIAVKSIYTFEMARFFRTITQSLISPVLSTSLYFVVFGAAIGSRIQHAQRHYAVDIERVLRHLLSKVYWYGFRTFIRAGELFRNRSWICRGRCDKSTVHRDYHSDYGFFLCGYHNFAPGVDGRIPRFDLHKLFVDGFYHRDMGR